MGIKTYGTMAVDWEQRINFDRLRTERLAKTRAEMEKSELGSLLCFDMNNVRYTPAPHIGTGAQDKANRFTLLPRGDEPILWDFGSAARHHQLHCPWLGERSRAGISMLRGARAPGMGRAAGGAPDQDAGRDRAAHPRRHDGRCGVRRALPRDEARDARERGGRARVQGALRPRVRVRRGGQRELRGALPPPPP